MAQLPLNVNRFYGMVPRVADEFLPEGELYGAKLAFNTRYESGNLTPYRDNVIVGTTNRYNVSIGAIFGIDVNRIFESSDKRRFWFSWTDKTDVVIGTSSDTKFAYNGQFFYFCDGQMPKMTYGDIALDVAGFTGRDNPPDPGAGPYPVSPNSLQPRKGYYRLGLPTPDSKLTAVVENFTTKKSEWFSRDPSGFSTIRTQTPHGLDNGDIVTISEFGDSSIDNPIDYTPPPTDPNPPPGEDEVN